MGDNFWETKYLNAEKSIEFLRQTHGEVLKGLHEEIESLQKQCSEYALKLSLQAPTAIEREEYEKRFKSYNSEYKKKDALIAEQRKLIEERNKNIKSLEDRIKTLERRQEIEMANKDQMNEKLRQQLENQSLQIANLTFQLHHLNKNLLSKLNQSSTDNNQANERTISPKLLKSSEHSQRASLIQTSSSSSSLNMSKEKTSQVDLTVKDPTIYYSQPKLNTAINRVKINIENATPSAATAADQSTSRSSRSEDNVSEPSSARSDRQAQRSSIPVAKILPPVVIMGGSQSHYKQHLATQTQHKQNSGSGSDETPFFNSTQSTLHTRLVANTLKKQLGAAADRRALITLPPIQHKQSNATMHSVVGDVVPTQLAVESPIKGLSSASSNAATTHHNKTNATQ